MANEYDIVQAFQKIEEELIASMKRNLVRHIKEEKTEGFNWSMWQTEQLNSLKTFRKQNPKLFKEYFSTIDKDIDDVLKKAYESGQTKQEQLILEALKKGKSKKTPTSFFKTNNRKLKSLIEEAQTGISKASSSILRYTNDQYRKIIFNAQVYANTGAGTPEKAIDMATKDFLSAGINSIEYSNGNRVNIASYAGMAIRTASQRAYLQGEGQKRDEWGIHTVVVHNRGGGCPYCVKYQGRVFIDDVWSSGTEKESKETGYPLLSAAIAGGLFHPNCKDKITTFILGINTEPIPPTEEEILGKKQNYIKDQKEKYIERNIEKYKRLELGSIAEEDIKKYHQKRIAWQNYKKKFKENNNLTFNDVTNNKKDGIITVNNLLDNLNVGLSNYNPLITNDITEQASKLLNMDGKPTVVDKETFKEINGVEIVRYIKGNSSMTADEIYKNTISGDIKYSNKKNSQYGRGIYFGDKSISEELMHTYGDESGKVITAKISKDAKILEFDSMIDYIKDASERVNKLPKELQKFYKEERSLLYMLDRYDGIRIKGKNYYCMYNRKVLVIKDE